MKKLSIILIALVFFMGCRKDVAPSMNDFTFNTVVSYEFNTAILHSEIKYEGTINELVLHYSKNQDLSDESTVVMEKNSVTRLYEARLTGLKDGRNYFYQIEVKDGIGSFKSETKSFVMDNGTIGAPHSLPYNQSFSNGIGSYYALNLKGDQQWSFVDGCAVMNGKNNQTPEKNEDLLICSPVILKTNSIPVADAKISMKYRASGFSSIAKEVTLWVTEDYTFGSNSWDFNKSTIIPVRLELTSDWKTIEIPLTQFVGKTVTVAVYYKSSTSSAGKLEIKEMNIVSGTVANGSMGDLHSLPYFQSFAGGFGSYYPISLLGDQEWQFSDHRVWMYGKQNGNSKANEDWLLSAPISVKGVSVIVVKIYHNAQYFNNVSQEMKLRISDSYVVGSSPANCTWKSPSSINWHAQSSDFGISSFSFDVSSFETVTLGIRYTSSTSSAGMISIKYLYIKDVEDPY